MTGFDTDVTVAGLTSVIVVSADSGPLLGECVTRLLEADDAVELILFDNASVDGEPQRVLREHEGDARLRYVGNPSNIGFGPACNRAVAIARGDVLLFVNPDCLLDAATMRKLTAALEAPGAGLVGAWMVDEESRPSRGIRRRDPTLRRALMTMSGLARFESHWAMLGGVEMMMSGQSGLEPVDAVSGACFAIRREVFDRLQGFDEGYFLHCEDLDLCRRVRDAGLQVLLDHDASVRHLQGSSSHHRAVFVARQKHRGMWRWFVKFDPAARNPLLRVLVWCGIQAHFGLVRLRHLRNGADAGDQPARQR